MRKRLGLRAVLPVGVVALAVGLTLVANVFGNTPKHSTRVSAAAAPKCGLGNGKTASGTPITLGAIVTNQPGTSFTDITNMAQAYFTCVNDNGGINGHPINYDVIQEQSNPTQVAADAKQLIASDHVLGIVGNTSIIDCAVNMPYYKQQGFFLIDSGIAEQCYSSPNSATVNMGPRYSSDGAASYLINVKHVKKVVFDQSNVPGTGYNVGGVNLIAKASHVPVQDLTENVPIANGDSVAEAEVQDAGVGGGVVLNFTPPEALIILQAAQQLGLESKVQWACSTPCNTNFLAAGLGSAWNNHLFVNAELNLPTAPGPDSALYQSVLKQYGSAVSGGLGSFSQMGFTEAQIAVKALLGIKGAYTVQSVNSAFENVKGFKTDLLCKPWYYGKHVPYHLPNNTDRTVTPDNGVMVQAQGCTNISNVDPEVAGVRKIEKKEHL
jgi:branched-chain amino acid transport system substrate-binding protein